MEDASTAFQFGHFIGTIIGVILVIVLVVGFPALFIVALIKSIQKKSKGWIITTVISGLVCLTLLGGFIFAFTQGVREGLRQAKKVTVYHTSDGVASLTGASSWKKLDLNAEDASLTVGNLFSEEYLLVISELRADFDDDFTSKEYAELAIEQSLKMIEGEKVTELSPLTINGMPAFQAQISGKVDGVKIEYLNTYVQGKRHFHQILTWTTPSRRKIAFPRFRKAIASFREVPQKESP